MDDRFTRRQIVGLLICVLGFALAARLVIGMGVINTYDTYWYRSWAVDAANNGLFSIYGRMDSISLDYPPLYLFLLYLVGLVYKVVGLDANIYMQMLLMKFWPIVFDVACAALLYLICRRRYGRMVGLAAAILWSLNPSFFFNTAAWGQTDGVMAFLLLLAFWYLEENWAIAACVAFAAAGLTKFQCLFFLPPFLIELFIRNRTDWLRLVVALLSAALTVVLVFFPFVIGAQNPFLFFDVYFGSADKYPYCSLYAYNLYCLLGLNWTHDIKDTAPIFGDFTWQHLSYIFLFLSVALLVTLYLLSFFRWKTRRHSGWVGGLLMMQCIFMLTTRMHERYQVVVIPFALMAWASTRNKRFLGLFAALSGITLINQFLVLLDVMQSQQYNDRAFWAPAGNTLDFIFSLINLVIFVWTIIECVRYFKGSDLRPRKSRSAKQQEPVLSGPFSAVTERGE